MSCPDLNHREINPRSPVAAPGAGRTWARGGRATARLLAYIFETAGMEAGDEALDSDAESVQDLRICVPGG